MKKQSEALELFNSAKKEVPEIRYTLPGAKKDILMRPYTTSEQKAILKAFEGEDEDLLNDAFDKLLINCVLNKGFDPNKLLTKDRECLLMALRMGSDSDKVTHIWKCTNKKCGYQNKLEIDLKDIDELKAETDLKLKKIKLDTSDVTIVVGPSTREDERHIMKHIKKYPVKGKKSNAEILASAYAASIKGMMKGEEMIELSFSDRMAIYEQFNMSDRNKLDQYFESMQVYGYNMDLGTHKCDKCGEETEQELDWLSFFLK